MEKLVLSRTTDDTLPRQPGLSEQLPLCVKLIRFLFFIFLLAGAFALVGAFLMMTPTGQTWVLQSRLSHPERVHGTVGSFWAFFGKLEIDDLHVEKNGWTLTVPRVDAKLPVLRACLWRNYKVKTFTAKGWTLDLSHWADAPADNPADATGSATESGPRAGAATKPATEETSSAASAGTGARADDPGGDSGQKQASWIFRGVLDAWRLPANVSVESTELEGDVLVAGRVGEKPVQIHVKISGGGLRADAEGRFQIAAEASLLTLDRDPIFITGDGELRAQQRADRSWEKLSLNGKVNLKGGSFPDQLDVTTSLAASRKDQTEVYDIELAKNGRRVLGTQLDFKPGTHQVDGDWKLDWQYEDSALLWNDQPWPALAAAGDGRIEIADTLESTHVTGAIQSETRQLEKLAPAFKRIKKLALAWSLDVTVAGTKLHAERLGVALPGDHPPLALQLVGPLDIDWSAGTWAPTDAKQQDLAHLTVNHFPLNWLNGAFGEWHFTSGEASGEVLLQLSKDHLSAHTSTPLTAPGSHLLHGITTIEEGADIAAGISADYTASAWKLACSPLTLTRNGQTLLTLTIEREKAAEKPEKINVAWNANLETFGAATESGAATATSSAAPVHALPFKHAEGNFAGSFDPTLRGDGTAAFTANAAANNVSAQFGLRLSDDGTVSLRAPIALGNEARKSELVVEGNYAHTREGHGLDATISGASVHLDQLTAFAKEIGQASELDTPRADGQANGLPFWKDWFGNWTLAFNELEVGGNKFKEAGGALSVTHDGVKLSYGHYVGPDLRDVPITGAISFNSASGYDASGSIGSREFDAKPFFAVPKGDDDPQFEGKFVIETAFKSRGQDWDSLLAHAEKQYHLTSTGGILRLLKVDVADALTAPSTPVSDTVGTVGSAVGKVFGHRNLGSGAIHLAKHTQAVIDFTLDIGEIAYKEIQIDATQGIDQNIRVTHLEIQADEEHLVGTGDVRFVAGQPLALWPLQLDLKFGARGKLLGSLRTAHLLYDKKDSAGYELLNGDARFTGSLKKFDPSPWHDYLAAAATASIPDEKTPTSTKSTASAEQKK